MSITIGAAVGADETTGSNVLGVTLTDDVPAGDETTPSGLVVVVANEEDGDAGGPFGYTLDQTTAYPVMSDDATVGAPYFLPNIPNGDLTVGLVPLFVVYNPPGYDKILVLRGAWLYTLLNPLSIGDVLTLDCSALPTTFDWLGAAIYPVTGLNSYPGSGVAGPPGGRALREGGSPTGSLDSADMLTSPPGDRTWDKLVGMFGIRSADITPPGFDNTTAFAWNATAPLDEIDGGEDGFWSRTDHGRVGYHFHVMSGPLAGVINTTGQPNANQGWIVDTVSLDGPGPPITTVASLRHTFGLS